MLTGREREVLLHLARGADTACVPAADGELYPTSYGPGDADIAFVYQADLEAEGTNVQDFVGRVAAGRDGLRPLGAKPAFLQGPGCGFSL